MGNLGRQAPHDAPAAAREADNVFELGKVAVLNHAVCLVNDEELDALDLAHEVVALRVEPCVSTPT